MNTCTQPKATEPAIEVGSTVVFSEELKQERRPVEIGGIRVLRGGLHVPKNAVGVVRNLSYENGKIAECFVSISVVEGDRRYTENVWCNRSLLSLKS